VHSRSSACASHTGAAVWQVCLSRSYGCLGSVLPWRHAAVSGQRATAWCIPTAAHAHRIQVRLCGSCVAVGHVYSRRIPAAAHAHCMQVRLGGGCVCLYHIAASGQYSIGATLLFLVSGQPPGAFPQQRMRIAYRCGCVANAYVLDHTIVQIIYLLRELLVWLCRRLSVVPPLKRDQ
jgi:hypothetical protein